MKYREVAPHPQLRKHIKCFWSLEHDYSNSLHDHEHLWADAHTELIFTSGQRYSRKVHGRTVVIPATFVVGPFQNELQLLCKGRIALAAARFWPWGFHALSRVPMKDLKNTVSSGRLALGGAFESLDRAMAHERSSDAKLAKLEQGLLTVLAALPRPKLLSRPIAMEVLETRGATRISALQRNHRIQARRLQRIFLEELGVTAKVLSRIVRFNHVKSLIERNPDIDLLKLAYECGYADQPHFTRNFRELFGRTPANYKALMKQAARPFNEQRDVVFLQDEAAQPG